MTIRHDTPSQRGEKTAGSNEAAVHSDSSGSLDRALDLLFHLNTHTEPLGVTAVARGAGLPKSSTHRLLQTLVRRGLVERDMQGRYLPGFGLIALGLGALDREPVVAVARPVLETTARELGETTFLCAARAGAPVVLDKVEGTGFLRASPQVGTRIPVHATAVGRLFLALAPDAVDPGGEPFESFAATTPRTRAELASSLAAIRARKLAENRGDWIAGLWVLAAPIFAGGSLRAALVIAAPEARMLALGPARTAGHIQSAAAHIAARLSGATA